MRLFFLLLLFPCVGLHAQMVNPIPNYAFGNSLGVGRTTLNDASVYLQVGPNGGANKGMLPPRVTDTATITGTKRQGLLVYSFQLSGYAYYDSVGNRWTKLAGGGGGFTAAGVITTSAASYNVNTSDQVVLVDASAGVKYINLPAASANKGRNIVFKKIDPSLWNIFIDPNGSETVEEQPTYRICRQYRYVHLLSDGVQWLVIAR